MTKIIKEHVFDYVKPENFFPSKDILNYLERQKTNWGAIYNVNDRVS